MTFDQWRNKKYLFLMRIDEERKLEFHFEVEVQLLPENYY
jgi:hypothetical protein